MAGDDDTEGTGDPVAAQYERWPYPDPRIGVDDRHVWNDPTPFHRLFWPDRPYPSDLRILVAGCGTSEAAAMARRNPAATVVGIDVSAASLAHQAALANQHGITNLRLERLALEQVASLGVDFDLVGAGGVLHHLEDPAAGLAALGAVLRPHGVVAAAVYAPHARTGVYMLQDLFERLDLGQGPQDVAAVRATLPALPAHHPLHGWLRLTGEQGAFESHVVDNWLHARDVAYTVPRVLDLVDAAGLAFQGWFRNAPYHPDSTFPAEHPLAVPFSRLSGPELWSAMELVQPGNEHLFMACRRDRPAATWRVDPDRDDVVPGRRFPPLVRHPPLPYDPRNPAHEALYRQIDGEQSVAECIARAGLGGAMEAARGFFRHLWRKDAVYFRW